MGQQRVWFAQAIRGVAALCVVWIHYTSGFYLNWPVAAEHFFLPLDVPLPQALPRWLDPLANPLFNLGSLGVGLFFLTSGFVIPFSLQRRTLGGFFLRRIFRLYPVHILGLAVILGLVALQIAGHDPTDRYSVTTILANAALLHQYGGYSEINGVTWTLVIEEVFYAIAAVLAWRGRLDHPRVIVALAVGLVAVAVLGTLAVPYVPRRLGLVVNSLALNAPAVIFIFVGVACHWWHRGRWTGRTALMVSAVLVAAWLVSQQLRTWLALNGGFDPNVAGSIFAYTAALVMFAALLLYADRVPYSRVLDRLGDASYPLYMLHHFAGVTALYWLTMWSGSFWLSLPVVAVAILLLSMAVHRWIEGPCNELGRRISSQLGWELRATRGHAPIIAPVTPSAA